VRKGIHPEYGDVVFPDAGGGATDKTRSAVTGDPAMEVPGCSTYPLVSIDISAASHHFRTGDQRVLDTAGRVERFLQRYAGRDRPARNR
jgi:large subunit ribosomal protein L31